MTMTTRQYLREQISSGQLFGKIQTTADMVFHLPFVARRPVLIAFLPPNDPAQWVYWNVHASGDREADRALGKWYSQLVVAASPRWGQIMRADGLTVDDADLACRVLAGAIEAATVGGGTGLEAGLFNEFAAAVHRGSLN